MKEKSKSVCVVVPVYKKDPSEFEKTSFMQCLRVLKSYDIFLVIPEGLDHSFYSAEKNVFVKEFPRTYFEGIQGYNALLLSSFFFKTFLGYKYMLIYQLDCFVFRDELEEWCSKNYDYIGAPWMNMDWLPKTTRKISRIILSEKNVLTKRISKIKWKMRGLDDSRNLGVGNGGFSLRNVRSSYNATEYFKSQIASWRLNEDYFFCIFLPLSSFNFHIAPREDAMLFSFDINPEICYQAAKNQLPFGCHAWSRDDYPYQNNLKFWLPIISDIHEIGPRD